jgi:hypothetical protein
MNQKNKKDGPTADNGEVTWTRYGAVYSKVRMAVVLWLFEKTMTCLPM